MLLLSNIKHILLLNIPLLATNSEILHFPAPSAGFWLYDSIGQLELPTLMGTINIA